MSFEENVMAKILVELQFCLKSAVLASRRIGLPKTTQELQNPRSLRPRFVFASYKNAPNPNWSK